MENINQEKVKKVVWWKDGHEELYFMNVEKEVRNVLLG